jgi:hypothetical protein
MMRGRHHLRGWGSWIERADVSLRKRKERTKERKINKNKQKQKNEKQTKTKERKVNERNRDEQRQRRKTNNNDECLDTASCIFPRASGQIAERKLGMKFY